MTQSFWFMGWLIIGAHLASGCSSSSPSDVSAGGNGGAGAGGAGCVPEPRCSSVGVDCFETYSCSNGAISRDSNCGWMAVGHCESVCLTSAIAGNNLTGIYDRLCAHSSGLGGGGGAAGGGAGGGGAGGGMEP